MTTGAGDSQISFEVKVGVNQGWVYIKPIAVPVNNGCGIKGDQSRTAVGYALCR